MPGKEHKPADQETNDLLEKAMKKWYRELAREKVRIAILMVHPRVDDQGKPLDHALKFAGAPAVAKIEVVAPKIRVLAGIDVLIQIDAFRWEDLINEQRIALLDHELRHLYIKTDSDGVTKRRPDGSVELGTMPDDWLLSGFKDVVQRHGQHAIEAMSVRQLHEDCQEVFEFLKDTAVPDAAEAVLKVAGA